MNGNPRSQNPLLVQYPYWGVCFLFLAAQYMYFIASPLHNRLYFLLALTILVLGAYTLLGLRMPDKTSPEFSEAGVVPAKPFNPENEPVAIRDSASFLAAVLYLLFITAILWEPLCHPREVWGLQDMGFVYPFRHFWVESLKSGDPALWEPFASLGQPLPETMYLSVFSPFSLLYFFLPLSWAMTWVSFAHLFLAAFGTYLFIRTLGGGVWGSFLGGMAFAFSSFFLAHAYAGGINMVWAASWFPLVLFFLKRYCEDSKISRLAIAGILMGLQILEGHPQMTFYSFMMIGFFLLIFWFRKIISFWKLILGGVSVSFLSALLSPCLWIPSWQFIRLSNRWGWTYKDIMTDFTNLGNFRYFIDPFFRGSPQDRTYEVTGHWGYHEMATYMGLIPILLAVCGLFLVRRKLMIGWFWLLTVLFTLLAMADSTPLTHRVFQFFYDYFPGFSHNRSVARIMLLSLFCLSCAAGLSLNELVDLWNHRLKVFSLGKRRLVLALAATLQVLLLADTAGDLWQYDIGFVKTADRDYFLKGRAMFPGKAWPKILEDKNYPRVQSGYNSDFELFSKVSQLISTFTYAIIIREAYGYLEAMRDNWDTPLSDLVSLKYLYTPTLYGHPTERWKPFMDNTVVNTKALPRAFLVGGYILVSDPANAINVIQTGSLDIRNEVMLEQVPVERPQWNKGYLGPADITHYGNRSVEISCQTSQAAILFLSDPYYPYWKATVDGVEKPILRADGVFRAVVLDKPGKHLVRMDYKPVLLYVCSAVTLAFWVLLAILCSVWPLIRPRLSAPLRRLGLTA